MTNGKEGLEVEWDRKMARIEAMWRGHRYIS